MIHISSPSHWKDYELIDCGNFEKLERFGSLILIRPEPQAVWNKALTEKDWSAKHHIKFVPKSATAGFWQRNENNKSINFEIKDRWNIEYKTKDIQLKFRLALTSFKHVGIFPEQASNWDFMAEKIKAFKSSEVKILNLFAYTGGASVASKAAGADVTHVDSIKQVVSWANENMELSGLANIRWVVEDALKFVKREVKRGKKYHGIILDPPAYGHGPNGEKWKLEENISEMMSDVAKLLDAENYFLILNTYSLGFSSLIIENLLKENFPKAKHREVGELYLQATAGPKLPLGVFGKVFS